MLKRIGTFLAGAPDREGGRKERNEKRNNAPASKEVPTENN